MDDVVQEREGKLAETGSADRNATVGVLPRHEWSGVPLDLDSMRRAPIGEAKPGDFVLAGDDVTIYVGGGKTILADGTLADLDPTAIVRRPSWVESSQEGQ
ncbi:hypothetical protein [Gordonia malaquae]|uniref:hypothetical protein n=1 Tax=Gordonia malaquae TaxID=410332 RepID=UPI00301B2DD7